MTDTIKARNSAAYDWLEDADGELKAMSKQRQQEYELELLDAELGLSQPEVGTDLMLAAARDLQGRGIDVKDASQAELLAALIRVSPWATSSNSSRPSSPKSRASTPPS